MFGIEILEVVIGLIFVYLLLSLLAAAINEIVMRWLYSRGRNLQIALQTMLGDETGDLSHRFFHHPLIYTLKKRGHPSFPSYISRAYFAKVLTELLCHKGSVTFYMVKRGVEDLPKESNAHRILLGFVDEAQGNLSHFKLSLEQWYEEVMNQASGWYKTKVQQVLFVLGLVISIAFNANTFQIAQKLSIDPEARQKTIEQAYAFIKREERSPGFSTSATAESLERQVEQLVNEDLKMASTALGTGWKHAPSVALSSSAWWKYASQSFLGWVVTAFAITLGASFWFDLLKKVMHIRTAAKKPDESSQ